MLTAVLELMEKNIGHAETKLSEYIMNELITQKDGDIQLIWNYLTEYTSSYQYKNLCFTSLFSNGEVVECIFKYKIERNQSIKDYLVLYSFLEKEPGYISSYLVEYLLKSRIFLSHNEILNIYVQKNNTSKYKKEVAMAIDNLEQKRYFSSSK